MLYACNWKKSLLNMKMMVSCIVAFLLLIQSVFSIFGGFYFNKNIDMLSATITPFASSTFMPVACIFPTLPFAFNFLEEYNSGYIKLIHQRMSCRKIITNQIFFTAISGAVAVFLPCMILFGVSSFMCAETTTTLYPEVFIGTEWEPYMLIWGGRFVLFLRLINMSLAGMVWALVALLCSLIFLNRYVAFVTPLVIYQAGWLCLHGDYLGYFNSLALFRGGFSGGLPGSSYIIHICSIIILVLVIRVLMRRRLEDA